VAARELHVWANGQLVGAWAWSRTGTHSFTYDDSWLRSPQARPLSLSLPIAAGVKEISGASVEYFFDNLLPDNDRIRERIRARYRLKSVRAQELLAAIGRDCVGAVQLLPPGVTPDGYDRIDAVPLSDPEIEQTLIAVTGGPLLGQHDDDDDFRISIAGAQEKTALLKHDGKWCRPHGATPTTHILKLPLGLVGNMQADMSASVENEWLCSRIMAALGFDVAATGIATFGTQKVLVVERFDRRLVNGGRWIARLPQEDMCQANGAPPSMKYEKDGGPGMRQCLALLATSTRVDRDRLTFVLANLAFWLLAATDGHAKNFSLALLPGGGHRLTPLYDILSAWPVIGKGANRLQRQRAKLAMAVHSKNVHYLIDEIQVRHWQTVALQSGVEGAWESMRALVAQVGAALEKVEGELPDSFPAQVWTSIRDGMLAQQRRFQAA
jgi:serine/threonine-protein kinase HipA